MSAASTRLRLCAALVVALPAHRLHAEQGVLVLNVEDTMRKPVATIQLGLAGQVGSATSDANGRARLQLAVGAKPGDPITLTLLDPTARKWVIVSPLDGFEHLPAFDGTFGSHVRVVVARRGDATQLTPEFFSMLVSQQGSGASGAGNRRSLVSDLAASLQLPPQEVEAAFRSFVMNAGELNRAQAENQEVFRRILDEFKLLQAQLAAERQALSEKAKGTTEAERDALRGEVLRLERENLEQREALESLRSQVRDRTEYRGDFDRLVEHADAERSALVTVLNPPAAGKVPWQFGAVTYVNPDQELMGIGAVVYDYVSARQNRAMNIPDVRYYSYKEWTTGGDKAFTPKNGTFVGRMASGGPVSLNVDGGGQLRSFRSALRSGGRGRVVELGTLASFPCRFQNGYVVTYLANTAEPGAAVLILKGASEERIVGWLLTRRNLKDEITLVEFEAIPQGTAWPSN